MRVENNILKARGESTVNKYYTNEPKDAALLDTFGPNRPCFFPYFVFVAK